MVVILLLVLALLLVVLPTVVSAVLWDAFYSSWQVWCPNIGVYRA
jgi:hypothetical protein